MDFALPDPAGVGPSDPALLRSRGADPLIEVPSAHFLRTVAGLPFQPVPGALSSTPNALPYSVVESVLGPILAVDKSVMGGAHDASFLGTLVAPSKFEAALSQAFLETPNVRLDANALYTSLSAAATAILDFTDRLDATALHPAYLLTSADVFATEPFSGTLPIHYRSLFATGSAVTYGSLANESGFLTPLGFLGHVMFGRALASSRDAVSAPTRSALAQIESMSQAADLLRVGATLSASTLRHWLDLTALPGGMVCLTEIGSGPDRREQCLRDRHIFVYGDTSQKESILAGLVLRDPLRTRLPNISRVLGRNCSPVDARVSILRMVRSISGSATADMANIATLENLEPTLKNLIPTLTMPSLVGASLSQRVDAVVKAAGDGHSYGVSGTTAGASAGASAPIIDKARVNLFADGLALAMGRSDWRAVEAQLTAELALPNPSSLKLHDLIVNSPILGARRLVLGSKDSSLYQVQGLSQPLTQALSEMDDFRSIASMMLVCDLATMTTAEPHLIEFRLSEKTSTALRRGAFDEIDWVNDILVEVMRTRNPQLQVDPFPTGLYDPRVPQMIEPLMQRVSRLLGLPLLPPPPPPPAAVTTLAVAGGPTAVAPAPLFASLSQIVSTIAAENLDITGHPSPYDGDYLAKLKLFEASAWREASTEFQRRVVSAKNPAGHVPTTVLPQTSAARGTLALMRATKSRHRDDAHANPTTYAILAAFHTHGLPSALTDFTRPQRTSDREGNHSRSRSPDSLHAAGSADPPGRPSALVSPGSRVASTLFFAADGSSFWYTSPLTRERVSAVYDFDTLERIAGRTRDQLDFPVLLSTMPASKRMSLCAHSHLQNHQTINSAAHQLPFANFLDQVHQHFRGPAAKSPAAGTQGAQHNRAPDGRTPRSTPDYRDRRGDDRRSSQRPSRGKSPNPGDARRSHRSPPRPPADTPALRSRSPSARDARSPSRSPGRDRSRSPHRVHDYSAAAADGAPPARPPDSTAAHAGSSDASPATAPIKTSTSPRGSPKSRGSASQHTKWLASLVLPGKTNGTPSTPPHGTSRSSPPLLSLTQPAHSVVRTMLLVIALAADAPMRLLVPPDSDYVIGTTAPRAAPRSAAVATAHVLAAALYLPGIDLTTHCIPIAERIPALGDVSASVDRIVALPLSRNIALSAIQASRAHLPGWRWLTLGALSGLAVYAVTALAFARVRSYFPSSSVLSARRLLDHNAHLRSGGRDHALASPAASRRRPPIPRKRPHGADPAPDAPWLAARTNMAAADAVLRRMLLAIPESDPDAEGLQAFADLLRPLNEEEVPPFFKTATGLPSFNRADLFWQPFSVRVGPPKTDWLPRLPPQPAPPPGFSPKSIEDLLEPRWFAQLCAWYVSLGMWLLDLSEASASDDSALERILASRPKVLVVPASGFVPAARGIIWDLRRGSPQPVDFTAPIDTHLNLDLIRRWMRVYPDYPDRELFSHLLDGVRFKTEPATQMVLQPHLSSLAQGFVSVHRELVRLTDKGFFQTFAHPPYAPWVTLPMGVAFRKLEPDRPRRTTDGGAPRKGVGASQFLVDADGVRVLPLNLLARFPVDDVKRGTASVFTDAWKARLEDADACPPLAHSAFAARLRPARHAPAGRPLPRALLLFSGPCGGPDTLSQQLASLGVQVVSVDRKVHGNADDVALPHVLANHVRDIADGRYAFVFAATPCSSYSVAVDNARPQLRSRAFPRGLPTCPAAWRAYVQRHNILADATVACILAAERSSTPWAVENPAARWDDTSPAHWRKFEDWATLWDLLIAAGIAPPRLLPPATQPSALGVLEVTFAACAFGAPYQKYTTVWASSNASSLTAQLRGRPCTHAPGRHDEVLQGWHSNGVGAAADAAAYVPALSAALAGGIEAVAHAVALANSLSLGVRPSSPGRPTTDARPASPALRPGHLIDVDITRSGSTPLLSNPFKLGPAGKDERLRQLAVVVYADWLDLRTVPASDMSSALPVAHSMRQTTGDNVLTEIQRIVARYGPHSAFHLVCGSRCHGKLCHGAVLAALFEQVADSAEALPFPKELKPTVPEIMADLSVLMHLSALTNLPVYQVVSDVKDFFNQHYLAPEDKHKVGLVTLDPRAIVAHADKLRTSEPALANIAENVLGYGLACASNICQRTAHLLVFIWLVEMHKAAAPVVAALRRRYPVLHSWLDQRARVLEPAAPPGTFRSARYSQARLWTVSMYTDDGHQAMLGPQLTITGLRVWRKIMGELRLTMAIVQKHGLGQQVTVQGCRFNTGLGVVFVPEDKLRRAVRELDAAVAGRICLREYHSLVSFLQSLTFVVGMSRSAAYGLYAPLSDATADPDAVLRLPAAVKLQLLRWRRRLLQNAGAPFHAAIDYAAGAPPAGIIPASAPCVFYIRSDASKDGARLPGLGGALGALLWRYPNDASLSSDELRLPIAVLEFAAYFGSVEVFADLVASDAMVVSEVDALSSADAITREAARSPLMQHIHKSLLDMPAFRNLDGRHAVGHIYGEANVMADAASRGNYLMAKELAAQLGMTLEWRAHGPRLTVLMSELVALCLTQQPPNTALAQTAISSANLSMTGTPIAHPDDAVDTADLELLSDYAAGAPPVGVSYTTAPRVFYLRGALDALLLRRPDAAPLSSDEWRPPVAVLEFAAYLGAVQVFADLIATDAMVVSVDVALSSAGAVAPPRGPNGRRAVSHVCGKATVIADAAGRGNYLVARELAAQLGVTLELRAHGPRLMVLTSELLDLCQAHQPPNTALAQTAISSANLSMTGTPIAHPDDAIDTADLELLLRERVLSCAYVLHGAYCAPPLPFEHPPPPSVEVLAAHHILAPCSFDHSAQPPARPYLVAPRPSCDATAAASIADLLALDSSSLALRPTSFDLRALCAELYNPSTAQPARTSAGQNSAWRHWAAWCSVNNTAAWRLTRHATDTDFHREAILQAGFIRFCHLRQSASPRSGRRAALVSSALKTLCHIRKMHRDRNFPMCPSPLVTAQVRRLLFEYKAEHGVADMIPKRKEPFTRHILVDILLATPDGYATNIGPVSWRSRAGRSLRALVATLAQAGFRKGEISVTKAGVPCDANCLSRAALSWLLAGRAYAVGEAPFSLLRRLGPGDFAVLAPCPSKSDPFDMVWGGDPIWLPFQPNEPLCACAALAEVELLDVVPADVDRGTVALFTTDGGLPFSDAQLDRLLQCLLSRALPPASARLYSWHSARIFLATTLLASGATHPEIQALCRWQTTDSIKIYARLTSSAYSRLLGGAMAARVSTARAQNLALAAPFIDAQDVRRAAAAAPQPPFLLQGDVDLDVHPDDDADDDDLDSCRDPPRPAPRLAPTACVTPLTTPAAPSRSQRAVPQRRSATAGIPVATRRPGGARARASFVRPPRAVAKSARARTAATAVERPPVTPVASVAHLSFQFPSDLSGYITYAARPSARRPPAARTPVRAFPQL